MASERLAPDRQHVTVQHHGAVSDEQPGRDPAQTDGTFPMVGAAEGVRFVDARYGDAASHPLIEELQDDMAVRYGGRDATPVEPAQFDGPVGAFVVLVVDGVPVGCGGIRRHDDRSAELKRMFVRDTHRRRGLASALLAELERRARAAGYARLVLETGTAQPEAVSLYERRGYRPIAGFGHYADEPLSLSYAKDL